MPIKLWRETEGEKERKGGRRENKRKRKGERKKKVICSKRT